jgi:hypothetical protein
MSDPPSNRCGYTYQPDHEGYADPNHQNCCWRPPYDGDADRCAWHTDDTDAKTIAALQELRPDPSVRGKTEPVAELLDGAVLAGCEIGDSISLSRVALRYADLTDANLRRADLTDADLRRADLTDASLYKADLTDTYLSRADLTDADLHGANLTEAFLREADLTDANLRQASLDHVGLHQTTLDGVGIDEGTTAEPPSLWELGADAKAEPGFFGWRGIRRLRALFRSQSNPSHLMWAEQQYRRLNRLYRERDLGQDDALEIQEKHARRKRVLAEGNRREWIKKAFARWVLGYGLQIGPILGVMLAVIAVCTLLYPATGFVDGSAGASAGNLTEVSYETMPPSASIDTLRTLGRSLYFSTITFSTLGYADVAPVGWGRAVATVESFIGALSMAYLVSVLSRRAIR